MNNLVKFEDLGLKDYLETWNYQEMLLQEILKQKKEKEISGRYQQDGMIHHLIFVEHPHVYTLGKSGSQDNLLLNYIQLKAKEASFYRTNRGGDITYHGPGQIVGYPILDLECFKISMREYIFKLEESIILALRRYGLKGERLPGATGVWLDPSVKGKVRKICAIGVRVSRYVTMHGFAFNVNTDLSYFDNINPCGFTDKGVTSLARETGYNVELKEAKKILQECLKDVFHFEWLKT
jgi:lipoyl(octanoyl) transferase